MSRDNGDDDDDKPDQDEAELARISSRLQDIDPTFFPGSESGASASEAPLFRPLTKEDFQIILGVKRFRCPEVLFNPNFIGIDQSGLDEMVGVSLRRLPTREQGLEDKMTSSILVTGILKN